MADSNQRSEQPSQDADPSGEPERAPERRAGDLAEDESVPADKTARPEGPAAKQTIAFQDFQGPFPPPDVLRGYKEIDPDLAERTIAWTEREQAQRHQRNEIEQDQRHRHTRRGQWMALALGLAGIAAAVPVGILGEGPWAPIGAAIITASVFGLLAATFGARRQG